MTLGSANNRVSGAQLSLSHGFVVGVRLSNHSPVKAAAVRLTSSGDENVFFSAVNFLLAHFFEYYFFVLLL